jgi:hypothetical protein
MICTVTCWGTWPLLNIKIWRARVLETPFGLLLRFITALLVVTTITFTMCALHFRVDSLSWLVLWLLASWLLLWPSDIASLSSFFDLLWSTPVFILLGFYFLPPWNRVLAPQMEDTMSKGYFSSSTQRWLVLLRNPTIRSLFVVAGRRYLSRCLGISSRWLAMLTSVLAM